MKKKKTEASSVYKYMIKESKLKRNVKCTFPLPPTIHSVLKLNNFFCSYGTINILRLKKRNEIKTNTEPKFKRMYDSRCSYNSSLYANEQLNSHSLFY